MNAIPKIIDRELALERAGGNAQLADELFAMLLRELPQHRDLITQSYAAADYPALQAHTHKLNGSATYCGVPALKAAAETLETSIKRGEQDRVPTGVEHLLQEIDRVMHAAA